MRLLITSGPTREPIDAVRFVSNVSSGRLGTAIAGCALARGHDVVFLRGEGSLAPPPAERLAIVDFGSARSLLETLRARLCAAPHVVVHAAAVADYAPEPVAGKVKSDAPEWTLRMVATPKIADEVKRVRPDVGLILFKLEAGIPRDELHRRALATARRAGADAIVANLVEEVGADRHAADLLWPDGRAEHFATRDAAAEGIVRAAERIASEPAR